SVCKRKSSSPLGGSSAHRSIDARARRHGPRRTRLSILRQRAQASSSHLRSLRGGVARATSANIWYGTAQATHSASFTEALPRRTPSSPAGRAGELNPSETAESGPAGPTPSSADSFLLSPIAVRLPSLFLPLFSSSVFGFSGPLGPLARVLTIRT